MNDYQTIRNILETLPVINKLTFKKIKPEKIINEICSSYNISFEELRQKSKKRHHVEPRQLIAFFLKKYVKKTKTNYTGLEEFVSLTLQEIAIIINKKNHGTIIHAIKEVENQTSSNRLFKTKLKELETKIKEGESS